MNVLHWYLAIDVPEWLTHCHGLLVTHLVHRGAGSAGGTKPAGGWAATKPCERVPGRSNRNKEPHHTAPDPGRIVLKCFKQLPSLGLRRKDTKIAEPGWELFCCVAALSETEVDDCLTDELMPSRASSLSKDLPTASSTCTFVTTHDTAS